MTRQPGDGLGWGIILRRFIALEYVLNVFRIEMREVNPFIRGAEGGDLKLIGDTLHRSQRVILDGSDA